MPAGKPVLIGDAIVRMRELAKEGLESREAWEKMRKEGSIPDRTLLATFRQRSQALHISWGNNQPTSAVIFAVPKEQFDKVRAEAFNRHMPPNVLCRKVIQAVIKDNLWAAMLDN